MKVSRRGLAFRRQVALALLQILAALSGIAAILVIFSRCSQMPSRRAVYWEVIHLSQTYVAEDDVMEFSFYSDTSYQTQLRRTPSLCPDITSSLYDTIPNADEIRSILNRIPCGIYATHSVMTCSALRHIECSSGFSQDYYQNVSIAVTGETAQQTLRIAELRSDDTVHRPGVVDCRSGFVRSNNTDICYTCGVIDSLFITRRHGEDGQTIFDLDPTVSKQFFEGEYLDTGSFTVYYIDERSPWYPLLRYGNEIKNYIGPGSRGLDMCVLTCIGFLLFGLASTTLGLFCATKHRKREKAARRILNDRDDLLQLEWKGDNENALLTTHNSATDENALEVALTDECPPLLLE